MSIMNHTELGYFRHRHDYTWGHLFLLSACFLLSVFSISVTLTVSNICDSGVQLAIGILGLSCLLLLIAIIVVAYNIWKRNQITEIII